MRFYLLFIIPLLLSACNSKESSMEKKLQTYDRFMDNKLLADSLPDSITRLMHDFAVEYPQNPKSEKYLYLSTILTETRGNIFETAKWCEEYVNLFPQGKNLLGAMISAASNYEKTGTVEKAIEFYQKAGAKFPNETIAKEGLKQAAMLKMGLVTPEQQLDYILKQKDSAQLLP
jgi:tetratricopeptide (TPR) repeat protein